MARRQSKWEATEALRQRRYEYDLARWGDWRAQQDRLRGLLPQAIDVIEETLTAGGPEAVKIALALVKLSEAAGRPDKPQRVLLNLADADELAAGLPMPDDLLALPGTASD